MLQLLKEKHSNNLMLLQLLTLYILLHQRHRREASPASARRDRVAGLSAWACWTGSGLVTSPRRQPCNAVTTSRARPSFATDAQEQHAPAPGDGPAVVVR